MAEDDDDDESFGDFTFASFPNQPFPSSSAHSNTATDDDWGNFANHSNQINGTVSKPFDAFGVSPDHTSKRVNDTNGTAVPAVSVEKPRGAIPLSIFGEEEEEEHEEPVSNNVFSNKSNINGVLKSGSGSNGSLGISDLISNLYNQRPQVNSENGSISKSNVAGVVNSNASNLNSDSEDDDGWEFKSAQWETGIKSQDVKAEVPKHDNGALDFGATWGSSTESSDKGGGWHLGFEFSSSSALQGHTSPQVGQKSESSETGTGFTFFNQNFGEFKNGQSGSGSIQNLYQEAPKMADMHPNGIEVLEHDGETPHGTIDPSPALKSHQFDGWGFGFNFNPSPLSEDNHISESYFKTRSHQDDNNKNNASPTNVNVHSDVNLFESKGASPANIHVHSDVNLFESKGASPANINVHSDVNLFESKGAVTEIGSKHEKSLVSSENHREALPLSIFGDEMPDTDEPSVSHQDLSQFAPTSPMKNGFNSPGSYLSINDMIWNLYNQVENKTPNVTPKASEHQIHASPEVSGSNLVTGDDDVDDEIWDFKDASSGTKFTHDSAQKSSFDHAQQVNEKGLQSFPTVLISDLTNGDDDFEDDSWEFKDAISGTKSQDQASSIDHRDSLLQSSTKFEPIDYVEFYSKLMDELCNDVLFHLKNLKKAQNAAALSGEDAKVKALLEEVREFSKALHQDNMSISNDYLSEDYSPREVHFDELLEVLKEPKFQPLESEYQLASRLSKAERDMKSATELLEDALSTLKILKLVPKEEQYNSLTTWSKIASVCSQELKHGAYIWMQAVQKNVHDHLLSNLKGVQYIHALGEIYRVAQIIGASAKVYKPWILSGSIDPTNLFGLLNECRSIWLASGLEEALFRLSNQNNLEQNDTSRELVESIMYIHKLDEHALHSYIISGEETTCHLSALPAGFIPGLNLVTWNGKHYFVKLANLWINLISPDPPSK